MPSVTRSQQRLMGQAYQVFKWKKSGGKSGLDPEDIDPRYRVEIEDLAASMKEDDLKAYAETKHTNLPESNESSMTGFLSAGPFPRLTTYVHSVAGGAMAATRDNSDSLVQSFMDYIEGKKKKKKDTENLEEDFGAPAASVANTPGMGNVTAPTIDTLGSGDTFGGKARKKRKKPVREAIALMVPPGTPQVDRTAGIGAGAAPAAGNVGSGKNVPFDNDEDNLEDKIGIMSYEKYKKWLTMWKKKQEDND